MKFNKVLSESNVKMINEVSVKQIMNYIEKDKFNDVYNMVKNPERNNLQGRPAVTLGITDEKGRTPSKKETYEKIYNGLMSHAKKHGKAVDIGPETMKNFIEELSGNKDVISTEIVNRWKESLNTA